MQWKNPSLAKAVRYTLHFTDVREPISSKSLQVIRLWLDS